MTDFLVGRIDHRPGDGRQIGLDLGWFCEVGGTMRAVSMLPSGSKS